MSSWSMRAVPSPLLQTLDVTCNLSAIGFSAGRQPVVDHDCGSDNVHLEEIGTYPVVGALPVTLPGDASYRALVPERASG